MGKGDFYKQETKNGLFLIGDLFYKKIETRIIELSPLSPQTHRMAFSVLYLQEREFLKLATLRSSHMSLNGAI